MSFELILPFFPEELRALLLDPSISDLMVNGATGVFVTRNGMMEEVILKSPYTNDRLLAAIQRVARILGQDLTTQNAILDTRLPDGSRVAVVGPPASLYGPTVTIRKFNHWYTSDELVAAGTLPKHVRDTVVRLIHEEQNGLISGGTGSGKTTLMKAFLDHIPAHHRLVVVEQPAELKVDHRNVVRWESIAEIPGQAGIPSTRLVNASMRHNPSHIILGETREENAYALLQAMNSGHPGTLSTIHADSAVDALERLAGLALNARDNLNQAFVRWQTGRSVKFVLYCERDEMGRRRVRELIRVTGYSHAEQSFETEEIYRASSAATE